MYFRSTGGDTAARRHVTSLELAGWLSVGHVLGHHQLNVGVESVEANGDCVMLLPSSEERPN